MQASKGGVDGQYKVTFKCDTAYGEIALRGSRDQVIEL
jgi:hypothetical protein